MRVIYTERGAGRPVLLLHGGAGPRSVAGFAERLAAELPARVITPTHPGFDGTEQSVDSIRELAGRYLELIDGLDGVTVIGNSIGGWIAAEMAIADTSQTSEYVLVDAVGIAVDGHPVADFFNLTLDEVAQASYYEPEKFKIQPTPEMAGNRAALAVYARDGMEDPALRDRLSAVHRPVLVVWGDSDGIADAEYGRAFAAAIETSTFVLLERTGHLPQLESPDALIKAIAG